MLIQAYVLCSRVIEYADVRVLQSSQCARSTFAGFITRQITSPMVCGFYLHWHAVATTCDSG